MLGDALPTNRQASGLLGDPCDSPSEISAVLHAS
jgi:hypothetical protein